jgi:hypothetical protein
MGTKDWENALTDIDAAMVAHTRAFNDKRPCNCDHVAILLRTKATILEKLGQGNEAKAAEKQAAATTKTHSPSRSGVFHNELKLLLL